MSEKLAGKIELREHSTTIEGHLDVGDFQRALDIHQVFVKEYGDEDNIFKQICLLPEPARTQISATLAELYDYQGDYPRAHKLLERYESALVSEEFVDWGIPLRAKLQLVQYLRLRGYPEGAIRATEKIKKQCEEKEDSRSVGDCCFYLVRLHVQRHNYKAAEQYYEEGLEQFSLEARSQKGEVHPALRWRLGLIFLTAGHARWRVGELTKASYRLYLAEGYLENTGDTIRKGTVALGIGCALRSKGEYQRALIEFEKALECYKKVGKVGHELNTARAFMNIGSTLLSLASFDAMYYIDGAKENLQKALDISERIENIPQQAEVWIRLSWLKLAHEVNSPKEGEAYARKALSLCKKTINSSSSRSLIFEGNIALGNACMQQGRLIEADKCFRIAFDTARDIDTDKCRLEAHLALAEFYCQSHRHLRLAIEHDHHAKEILGRSPNKYLERKEKRIASEIQNAKRKVFVLEADDEMFKKANLMKELTQQLQIWLIQIVDEKTDGNKTAMAKMLGMSRPGLDKLMKRLPLNNEVSLPENTPWATHGMSPSESS